VALRYLPRGLPGENSVSYSYSELLEQITRAANAFHSLGVRGDSAVSLLLPNVPQSHFALWGGAAVGVANPINPMLEAEHIASILNEVGAKVLVTVSSKHDADLWQKVESLRRQVPSLDYVLTVESTDAELPQGSDANSPVNEDGVIDFDTCIAKQPADRLAFQRSIDCTDVASWFHTGGTTGAPKLAPHTHFNEVVCAVQLALSLQGADASSAPVGLCGLPLFHVNAVFITGLALWLQGGEAVLATSAGYRTPEVLANFWALVQEYGVTMFSAVPTILTELLHLDSSGYNLESLEYAVCGAAPLATELARQFEEKTGLVLIEGYGQTEGTCATTLNPRYGERRIGSVGCPLPWVQVRIAEMDEAGAVVRDCEVGESGVVLVKGPNVFPGYKRPEQNVSLWVEEEWLISGDLGRLDEDGYLWLVGRSKDLIIRGGHNIDPQLIEEAFYRHDAVAEAAAVGKPDERLGELPVVFIQIKPGATVSAEELLDYAAETISERAAIPKEVHFVESMPVTAVGKIFKPDLRRRVCNGAS